MKIYSLLFFAYLLIPAKSLSQSTSHVVLVTIDGLRPDFYLNPQWGAENLAGLMNRGVYAKGVTSVFPSMTYPNHISIMTGTTPEKHGIYYNSPFVSFTRSDSVYWQFSSIKSLSLWEAARKAGLSTVSVMWPVSADAPVDYNIPDVGKLGERTYAHSRPSGLIEEIKEKVFNEKGTDMNFLFYSPLNKGIDVNIATAASYLIEKHTPGFTSIHLLGLDAAQHGNGLEGEPIAEAVRQADRAIGLIIRALESSGIRETSTIIVTGDHGFVSGDKDLHPNVWLKEAGLINNVENGDWKAFFYPVAGSSFLHLKDKSDKKTLQKVEELLQSRSAYEKTHFRVIKSALLRKAEADPAVDLALTGENGATLGWETEGEAIRPKAKTRGDHGHFPDFQQIETGFIAQGAGIKSGIKIEKMSVTDIAPLIARLLNLEMPAIKNLQQTVLSNVTD